ncbi:MAG: NAD(P)-dependent oxidoreductase [Vulcanimicrobiaceae bacterium]|jgi:3-hydroxyisobutyrate dehydrogenase-like beta-hydroxyacid dehydrogenase
MKIGVIGVGAMGTQIAINLARNGNTVYTYDRNPARGADADLKAQTTFCPDVASVVRAAELTITMTTNDEAVLDVAHKIVAEPKRATTIFVDLSSTSLVATRALDAMMRTAGIAFLDAAVYGAGVQGAKDGKSPIVISGPRETYDKIASTIAPLGTVDYVGELGRAKIIKILNNQLVGAFCVAAAEIITIGLAAGISMEKIVESLTAGSGTSYILERYYPSYIRTGSFGLGLIPITYMIKDIALACSLAQEVGAEATITELCRQIYQAAENSVGDLPFPEVYSFYHKLNIGRHEGVPA